MLIDELRAFLADYFEVLQTQEMALFDRVFHPDSVLYSQQDGQVTVRPFAAYRQMVQGRQSPASQGSPRQEEVLLIDVLSPTMAVVKVRLRLFNNTMEDHLNLMKHEGQWRIYAKHFTRAGSAA
jgi:Putative lumazine-binding